MEDNKPKKQTETKEAKGLKTHSYKLRTTNKPKLSKKQEKILIESREHLSAVLKKYMVTDLEELKSLRERQDIPAIDAMMITSVLKAVNRGDEATINWLLRYVIPPEAPPAQEIKITGGLGVAPDLDLENLTDEELKVILRLTQGKNKNEKKEED